jgi:hypothetical protein
VCLLALRLASTVGLDAVALEQELAQDPARYPRTKWKWRLGASYVKFLKLILFTRSAIASMTCRHQALIDVSSYSDDIEIPVLSAPDQVRQMRSKRALGGPAAQLERETRDARHDDRSRTGEVISLGPPGFIEPCLF